ncbi:FAD binding domain-containing protein [Rhodoligotrophos defluvii]|uniref:FAD binding domain-containing protein n=1 Tax=Rhodoligotrophos defluvii TaxID=2561934 RepID=UPI0010C9D390|nr:FAD binding domain-containing protein [Rhodoligotrophos defluvii]
MKPVPFDYVRPETAEEAVALLAEFGGDAVLLAGGMSLGPMLNLRLVRPAVLIDIGRIGELSTVTAADGTMLTGAVLRQSQALANGELMRALPLLGLALPWVGHVQTRNRGTLGGSVAHADPSAEIPLVLATLGGHVHLRSRRGRRRIPARDFFLGMLTTARSPEEMVLALEWPQQSAGEIFAFREVAQRHGDFAVAAVACRALLDHGSLREITVGIGGVEDRPVVFLPADYAGASAGAALAENIAAEVAARLDPLSDHVASAGQRRALARTLVRRALVDAFTAPERMAA